ncbi:hypothetical protein [Alcaligenes sp. SMD-FA]|uniref:hypothetical protein n=1 Tax=Alcaligenes sp. SMD-FA TaxID=2991054 RepID=UPI002226A0B1|nr:hypothetical protein [Alcaligenes sp. SMD-FA]UYY86945.1 hypothetical protein OKX01_16825 [Alcaligenes sp. SMD-FA]
MRLIFRGFVTLWLALFAAMALAQQWYEGGTLHDATLLEWKQATPENKLATIADMVSATYNRESFVPLVQNTISSGRMPAIKKIAETLVGQMDEIANDPTVASPDHMVVEAALMLMIANGMLRN